MRLDGVAAIVTGGASGLGRAAATQMAQEGARVTILDIAQD
ncbi:SDR family NAD(P)-dependent oxidoreductase, partial [Pseudomonas zeae]